MESILPVTDLVPVENEALPPTPSRGKLRQMMRNGILFLPNLVKLALRLVKDHRVSLTDKMVLAATVVYVLSPFDFLPDFIPFLGQVDDSYLIAVALLRLFQHTDPEVVREHWDGGGDVNRLLTRIAKLATFFLPKSVQRALLGRIDLPEHVADFTLPNAANRHKKT